MIVQAPITVWLLALTLRALASAGDRGHCSRVTALLCAGTTLPWLASVLLTDIFAGLAVLAVYLLVFADDSLRRFERPALVALIAFAVATHSATFAVVLALVLAAIAGARPAPRRPMPPRHRCAAPRRSCSARCCC